MSQKEDNKHAYGEHAYGNSYGYGGSYGNAYGRPYGGKYLSGGMNDNLFGEEESSFDWKDWLFKLLHYWYLFVIGIVVALGASYLKNRSWLPTYQTTGTILIEEYGGNRMPYGSQSLLQGFGVDPGYRNINNQVIMLGSYDLLCRVVDSLPFMNVDYKTIGRFKTRNLYTSTPIIIESTRIHHDAYGLDFQISLKDDGSFKISLPDYDDYKDFSVNGRYGEVVETPFADFTVYPTQNMVANAQMYFCFRSRESLVADFSSRLSLNFLSEGSSVLAISLISTTPGRDKDFIDKLGEVYLADNLARKNDVADNTIKFINVQLENISKSLAVSESAMTHFRQQNQIVDVSSHAGDILGKAAQYDAGMADLRLKETYLDYLTNYLKTNMENGSVVAPSSLGLNEPMLMTLVQQLNDLNMQRSELSEKNVFYDQYSNDIDKVKETIEEVVKSMRASLEIEKNDLNERYAVVKKEIAQLPEKELEMVSIERAYRIDDNYYTFFLQKRAEAEIQKASNTPDNKILDKARTLSVTNTTAKKRTLTTFLLIGLILPFLFVVLKELLNPYVRGVKELTKMTSYPLLGVIRHTRSQSPVLPAKSPRSSFSEMLRSIRTRIEFVVQRKSDITLLVSSAESGDGKTFFCSTMATIYAMTGKKVLLVDMDIRKPNIHEKLGIPGGLGVTNYLIEDVELDEVIHPYKEANFDVLLAGTVPPNPGELVRTQKVREMFDTLKERYDFIVIDTSPLGLVSDAYPLLEISDINLFVVRSHKTHKSMCQSTLEQLENDKANFYTVLADMPIDRPGYYNYGGSYGHYYRSPKKDASQYVKYYHDDDLT